MAGGHSPHPCRRPPHLGVRRRHQAQMSACFTSTPETAGRTHGTGALKGDRPSAPVLEGRVPVIGNLVFLRQVAGRTHQDRRPAERGRTDIDNCCSFHCLGHSCAVHMHEPGGSTDVIQGALGNRDTTSRRIAPVLPARCSGHKHPLSTSPSLAAETAWGTSSAIPVCRTCRADSTDPGKAPPVHVSMRSPKPCVVSGPRRARRRQGMRRRA